MKSLNWIKKIEECVTDCHGMSVIPDTAVAKFMPEELREDWNCFIRGQTGIMMKNGEFGIYIWDWSRFANKIKKNQPLVDTVEEWD
jgi:hypothetical protein